MTLVDALRQARLLFLDGKCQIGGMLMTPDLAHKAAGGNFRLASEVLEALDQATPSGMAFSIWVDGAKPNQSADGSVSFTYTYDRKPSEIAAVMGKAIMTAQRQAQAHVA